MANKNAKVRKQTFWNEVRVKNNCTYKDLARLIDMSNSYCSMICSGEFMPTDGVIRKMCELFDVSFDLGKEEFKRAHAVWKSSRRTGQTDSVKLVGTDEPVCSTALRSNKNIEILETIYGEVDFDVYWKISDRLMRGDTIELSDIYGKLSYADFLKIGEILKEADDESRN